MVQGGLACGALSATIENPHFKIEHAWSNDYDQQTCDTYAENICHENPETVICHDVRKLDLDDRRLTPIDGFAFGFPCNDFSVVGEHKGIDGNYGPLYQYGVAVLKNSELGRWFRQRLGIPNGTLITPQIMESYGCETVTFYKLAEDQFYMDF